MKNTKNFLTIAAAVLLLAGCTDSGVSTTESSDLKKSAEIYKTWTYTPEEFGDFLGSTFDDYCNYLSEYIPTSWLVNYSLSKFVESHRYILDEIVAGQTGLDEDVISDKWVINRYNFTYKTLSYSGEPITLSAALIVPSVKINKYHHTISAISLCPPHMPLEDECCATLNGTILMARAMYNHAVVVPDYQGRGVTAPQTCSCLHTHDHAIQSIDAAIAAKSLLLQLGYEFEQGARLYNVGVSEGGENSYEIQKQIENDRTDSEKAFLNLGCTFAANGSLDHVQYVKDKIGRVEYTGDMEQFHEQMQILADAFECLTPEEKQGYDSSIFYSTEIINSDSTTVNAEHPAIKALEKAMERNNITYNWNPRTPLTLAGSTDDTTIKLTSHAIPAYKMLYCRPDGPVNTNVKLDTFSTPIVSKISGLIGGEQYTVCHIMADMICFVHAIEYEDPGANEITDSQF